MHHKLSTSQRQYGAIGVDAGVWGYDIRLRVEHIGEASSNSPRLVDGVADGAVDEGA